MQSHPELQGCAASCADCGIRFLTHPRNAGRGDLRCPFGCREHHRQERSCQRSTAYYRTATGKAKKKRLNARRQGRQAPPATQPPPKDDPLPMSPALQTCVSPASEPFPVAGELQQGDVVLDEAGVASSPMLPYVRMVVSLIEGIEFTCREVVDLLRQSLRQHSIGAGRRVDYLLGLLHRHPP